MTQQRQNGNINLSNWNLLQATFECRSAASDRNQFLAFNPPHLHVFQCCSLLSQLWTQSSSSSSSSAPSYVLFIDLRPAAQIDSPSFSAKLPLLIDQRHHFTNLACHFTFIALLAESIWSNERGSRSQCLKVTFKDWHSQVRHIQPAFHHQIVFFTAQSFIRCCLWRHSVS